MQNLDQDQMARGIGLAAIFLITSCLSKVEPESTSVKGFQTQTSLLVDLDEVALQRSRFGQPKSPSPEHVFYTTLDVKPITLLFPVGKADVRYLVLQNPASRKIYLSCQSKAKDAVKMEWAIELKSATSRVDPALNGTLVKVLRSDPYRLVLRKPVPAEALKALKSSEALAAYQLRLGELSYWLVEASGGMGTRHVLDGIANTTWPVLPKPYPICSEERAIYGNQISHGIGRKSWPR